MRYRSDLPQMAMVDQLSDGYNMTFSAIVIGNIDSKELKEMTDLGNGIYMTVPVAERAIQGAFSEVVGKTELGEVMTVQVEVLIRFAMLLAILLPQFAMAEALKPMKMPSLEAYRNPEILWDKDAEEIDRTYGSPWNVWAARNDLELFSQPPASGGERIKRRANFLQEFKVLNKRGAYVLLCDPESLKEFGWASVKDLIILNQAFKDERTTITHKAILVNKFESSDVDPSRINIVEPLLSPAPTAQKRGDRIKILEFASIYQYHYPNAAGSSKGAPDYVLLGKAPTFSIWDQDGPSSINSIILGWVPTNRVLLWDTRQALEPNGKRKFPIFYFKSGKYLEQFYQNPVVGPDEDGLVVTHDTKDKIIRVPLPPNAPRYPIRQEDKGWTVIGIPEATFGEVVEDARIISGIESEMTGACHLDVVFVIDGTMSMMRYLRDAGVAAETVMDQILKIKRERSLGELMLKFGAVVYRDYKDGDEVYDAARLTSNVGSMKRWLNAMTAKNNEVFDENPDAYFPEAMFQGLVRAASDEIGWQKSSTKVIIQIGDAGNHSRGQDDYDETHIAGLLAHKDISFASFHVSHPVYQNPRMKDASDLYSEQVSKILNNVRILFNKKVEFMKLPENDKRDIVELNNRAFSQGKGRWYIKNISGTAESRQAITQVVAKDGIDQIMFILNNLGLFRLGDVRPVKYSTAPGGPLWMPQMAVSVMDRMEKKFGTEFMERLKEEKGRFFTEAFVKRVDPRAREGDPTQFRQMVLFERNSFEDLLASLRVLERHGWPPDNRKIGNVWEKMIMQLTGEDDQQFYANKSLVDVYKMALGITFQNDHFLLQLPLKKIKEGAFDNKEIAVLMGYLKAKYTHLNKVQRSDVRWFKVFTKDYIWLSSDELL